MLDSFKQIQEGQIDDYDVIKGRSRNVEVLRDASVAGPVVSHDVINARPSQTLSRFATHEPGRQNNPGALNTNLKEKFVLTKKN